MHADELLVTLRYGNSLDIALRYRPDDQHNWALPPVHMASVILERLAQTFINRMAIDEIGDTLQHDAEVILTTGQRLNIAVTASSNLDQQSAQALFNLAIHNLQTAIDNGSVDPLWVSNQRLMRMSKHVRWKLPRLSWRKRRKH